MNSVPSLFFALTAKKDFKTYDVSRLRIGLIGGAGYTTDQFKNIEDSFDFRLMASLGMTEATGGVTVTNPEDSILTRSTTVGRFMKNVRGSICDISTGIELPAGETGEICISGFMVMKGYYKQPELTKLAIDEKGRLHSGDLGFIDKDGNLHVTGRIKELINRGGEKISPYQIESILTDNDARIKAAKVIGIPDSHYGEEICACLILKDGAVMTADEVRKIVRARLAHYKVPKYVLFFETFPYNFKGKVTNKILQEEAIKMLKGQELY
jgi:fatty-acyl-CoA synthase